MSGVVKIEIQETASELKALLGQQKDAVCHEKLQALYYRNRIQTDLIQLYSRNPARRFSIEKYRATTAARQAVGGSN